MAWGYESSFTVEHDDTVRRRINCKDCVNYDRNDRSCMKRPLYLPEDGYDSWKNCDYFELDQTVSHYAEKKDQYMKKMPGKKQGKPKKSKPKAQGYGSTMNVPKASYHGDIAFYNGKLRDVAKNKTVPLFLKVNADGKAKYIMAGYDYIEKRLYVHEKCGTENQIKLMTGNYEIKIDRKD